MPFAALSMFHAASVLFAMATGVAVWRTMPNAGVQDIAFASLSVLLLGILFAEGAARRSERRHLLDRIDNERHERLALKKSLDELRKQGASRAAGGEDNSDLLAEMRLVRSQLARLGKTPPAKAPSAAAQATPVAVAAPVPAPAPANIRLSGDRLLTATISALQENRIDLYLQPVVRLPQRRAIYHECLTRLRAESGHIITPDQYLPIAEKAGMTSVIDNLSMFRCIQTLKARRGPDMSEVTFFCNLSPATLQDAEFFDQFVEYLDANRDLAGRIVFEIEARELLGAQGLMAANLDRLNNMGFRLSADHVDRLDMDLADLARHGVAFVKIDCGALIGDARRSALSVKEGLSSAGVTLIASMVEREEQVVELVEAEIDLAQGYLFGEPRPMREDAWRMAEAS